MTDGDTPGTTRDQAEAAPECEHAWAWVSPAGTPNSARLCMFCHQPDPDWLNEVEKLRAERDQARAELIDANLDREHADEVRKQANERADAYNEAHRKTLERLRRIKADRDRAVADLAALRGRVEALADSWLRDAPRNYAGEPMCWYAHDLRAALDGGQS